MAYTPTNWVTGDTVTATKLNKLEQGVANAGGAAAVRLSASGFNSGSKNFGYIRYAYFENGRWLFANDNIDEDTSLYGYALPNRKVVVVLVPADETIGAFIVPEVGSGMENTGGVSNTGTTVYFSWGSYSHCYRITGSGTAEFVY